MEWGGEWDNCKSIINKYIKKKKKKRILKELSEDLSSIKKIQSEMKYRLPTNMEV